jgi:hypothetical protein
MPPSVMPITAQFPQATLDQLKAQGIPLEGGSLVQSQDGRTLLVVGPQAQEAAARQRTLNLVYGGVAALTVIALLVYVFGGGPAEAEAERPEVATRDEGGREQLEGNLDKIAQLIDEGKLPQAERKLESAEEEFARDPELSDRADELRSRLEVMKALASARKHERDGDRISAVKGYRDVLALDAGNEEAKQRIKGLYPNLNPDMGFAIITIRSAPVTAEVTLDGGPLGSTPIDVPLHAGKYNISLTAPGYGSMQTALSVSAAKDQPYDYLLTKTGAPANPQPPVEQPRPPTGGGTKKPGGGGTKRPPDGQVKPKPNPAPEDDLLPVGPSKKR